VRQKGNGSYKILHQSLFRIEMQQNLPLNQCVCGCEPTAPKVWTF